MTAVIPAMDPRPVRTMMDMGMKMDSMKGMDMSQMGEMKMDGMKGMDMPGMEMKNMSPRVDRQTMQLDHRRWPEWSPSTQTLLQIWRELLRFHSQDLRLSPSIQQHTP